MDRFVEKLLPAMPNGVEAHEAADKFIKNIEHEVQFSGDKAYYSPLSDTIVLPPRQNYVNTGGYFSTYFHELGHWSGHTARLDRGLLQIGFNEESFIESYAGEELIAELCSSFLCAELGIEGELQHPDPGYISSWIKHLKDSKKAVFSAAAKASKAAQFLKSFQPGEVSSTSLVSA